MPFTLSHAAAALPFGKLKPVWPALVIGTFAPDLQYFIWISDEDRSGHHFPGVVFFTLPLALLLLWVFERCVKVPVIELLPAPLQRRLQNKVDPISFGGWQRFASIVMWVVIGIATHVVWDWFTHPRSWITRNWALFSHRVPVPFHSPVLLPILLQHASTVLGLMVMAAWLAAWYRRTTPMPCVRLCNLSAFHKASVVFIMTAIAVCAGYALAILSLSDRGSPVGRQLLATTVFEAVTLVFCVQVLIYGVARSFATRLRPLPPVQTDEQHG